jgi:hypothetical protein
MRTTRRHIALPFLIATAIVTAIGRAPVAAADEPGSTGQPSPPIQPCSQRGAAEYICVNHRAALS